MKIKALGPEFFYYLSFRCYYFFSRKIVESFLSSYNSNPVNKPAGIIGDLITELIFIKRRVFAQKNNATLLIIDAIGTAFNNKIGNIFSAFLPR